MLACPLYALWRTGSDNYWNIWLAYRTRKSGICPSSAEYGPRYNETMGGAQVKNLHLIEHQHRTDFACSFSITLTIKWLFLTPMHQQQWQRRQCQLTRRSCRPSHRFSFCVPCVAVDSSVRQICFLSISHRCVSLGSDIRRWLHLHVPSSQPRSADPSGSGRCHRCVDLSHLTWLPL